MRRWVLGFTLLVGGGIARAQSPTARLADPGLGPGPDLLARALSAPHTLIGPAATQAVLPRDSTYRQTVIVLGREAVVDGTVHGDVIVVGGDLHLHPRSVVSGRAIAIGGGVYASAMARVDSTTAFRDFTYDIEAERGGWSLRYRSLVDRPVAVVTLPGLFGFGLPLYDRSSGASISFGPLFAPGSKLEIEPRATYRSNLGAVDPSVSVRYAASSRTTLHASGEHGTFSNEDWIWPDLVNSVATLFIGHDARNHFRATRVQVWASRRWGGDSVRIEPYLGARWERGRRVGPDSEATGGPWSFHGRRSDDDMLRPNPPADSGDITSGLLGGTLRWTDGSVTMRAALDVEAGGFSPSFSTGNGASTAFVQGTFDGSITFPTFGLQTIRVDGHFVATASERFNSDHVTVADTLGRNGDQTPRQRWAYLGGSGSIPTLALLERGGDQLVYLDFRYNFPIERFALPFGGAPTVTIREVLGGADVGRFPSIAQATGVRVGLAVAYVEFMIDPVHGGRNHLGVGVSFPP